MKKTKIAYIIPSLDIGGSELKVIELATGLDKRRFESIIITITKNGILADKIKNTNVKLFCVNKKNKFDFFVINRIKRLLKKEKVDIVQTFTSTAKLWGRLGAIFAKTKIIISTEESLFRNKKLDIFFEKKFIKKTNIIIANSNSTKDSAQKLTKIKDDKYFVIYNGINLNPFLNEHEQIKNNEQIIKFITVARLDVRKGLDTLVNAAALLNEEFKDFSISIVGEGNYRNELENLISTNDLKDKISVLGFRQDIPKLLKEHDVFILPSKEEGFGNAVIEAFASNITVISSNAGGLKEIVTDGFNGLVFKTNNIYELKEKMHLLIKDSKLREQLKRNAFLDVNKYSKDKMILEHEIVYNKLMGREDI